MGAAWLVNTSWQPMTVVEAKAGCGCTTLHGFAPVTLQPGEIHEVAFTVRPPRELAAKPKRVPIRFRTEWGDPVALHASIALAQENAETLTDPDQRAATSRVDGLSLLAFNENLGDVASKKTVETSVWLLNHGSAAARLTSIKAGCGCTEVIGFEPTTVLPGAATRVRLRVTPDAKGKSTPHQKSVSITASIEGTEPLRAMIAMDVQPAEANDADGVAQVVADSTTRTQ